ncbi:hypothetical protein [Providencia sp. PROV046]|uniref:hypothetical protein n=1 Tax=Providencia sp. PROV046 TaxID=2949776 RepID=UPI0029350F08|nr:hypothetical protein [Providencia sp. PROV046]WOC02070.1 hypothetical protein P3L55_21695 [Providencia sp. PROV046]
MQINLNTPGTAATSTIQTVAPAAQAKTTTTTAPSTTQTLSPYLLKQRRSWLQSSKNLKQ